MKCKSTSDRILITFYAVTVMCGVSLGSDRVFAEESLQPYIDQLKRDLKEKEPGESEAEPQDGSEPYIDSVRKKLEAEQPSSGQPEKGYPEKSYIDQLREAEPELREEKTEESYTEVEKPKLPPPEEGGAIQAVVEGRSELHPKMEGTIRHAFGIRYGAALTRNLTGVAGTALRNFNDVYGASYAPDLSLFYEFKPFHNDWFGDIGLVAMGGLAYYQGSGQFGNSKIQIPGQPPGTYFPSSSSTKFQFFNAPVMLGASYRFNLAKYVKPFVMAGPTIVGLVENRNDGVSGNKGYSIGMFASGGASLLLDWISPSGVWDLYSSYGIQHYYLTVEFSNLSTFAGLVNVNIYGITAGITFEY